MELEKLADEIAMILFNKPYSELTAEEKRALYDRVAETAEELD